MARKNVAAVALGRRGGKATAQNLSPEERSLAAKKAAESRWNTPSRLDGTAQTEWRHANIPHRIRAAGARLDLSHSILGVYAYFDPPTPTEELKIYRRFETDSIWEGRFAAMRWLIEFIGISQRRDGKPGRPSRKDGSPDVRIDQFDGGWLFQDKHQAADFLAAIWKGCSQASSHPTHDSHHADISEAKLAKALALIAQHLQDTVYNHAGEELRSFVVSPP